MKMEVNSRHILSGPRELDQKPPEPLGQYFYHRLLEYGDKVAQVQEMDEGQIISHSFSELLHKAQHFTNFLRSKGLGPGDTIMVCCFNTVDCIPAMLGTLFLGGTLAGVNPLFDTNDMLHLLRVIEPDIVICNSAAEVTVLEAISRTGKDIPWISMDQAVQIMNSPEEVVDFQLGEVGSCSDAAFILCSSGTSGKPKGVELSHSGLTLLMKAPFYYKEDSSEAVVVLNIAGPFWISFYISAFKTLSRGSKLVLLKSFTPEGLLHTIDKFKVNWVFLGPDHVVAVVKCDTIAKYDTSSLQSIVVGGASPPLLMFSALKEKLGVVMTQAYGLTECMGMIIPDYNFQHKPGTVGRLSKNSEAKVLDIDTGELLDRNCEGELCFRSPMLMRSYRNNPEATRAALDKDGFLHTGDVGYFDENGLLFVKDRIKDLIKYKRDHVLAADIEEVLLSHPGVKEATVVGVFHEEDWEHATGAVVLRPGANATAEELLSLVQEKLPTYKWLHGGLKFVESVPRNSSGKVLKRLVKEMLTKTKQ